MIGFGRLVTAVDRGSDHQCFRLFPFLSHAKPERILFSCGVICLVGKMRITASGRAYESREFVRLFFRTKYKCVVLGVPIDIRASESGRPFELEVPSEGRLNF